MLIDFSDRLLVESFATFGSDLLQLETSRVGAKEADFKLLLQKANDWFETQRLWLQKNLCTDKGATRPEVTAGTALLAVIVGHIRAQFGDHFPAESAAAALVSYGVNRFCAESHSRMHNPVPKNLP
jgi:hypothetical protein